jgi:hypothetical protein
MSDYRPENLEPAFVSRVLESAPVTETVGYAPNADAPIQSGPQSAARAP